MPFLTEEIWQNINERSKDEALIIANYPTVTSVDKKVLNEFDFASEVISGIRTIRKEQQISFKNTINVFVINNEKTITTFDSIIKKLGNINELSYVDEKIDGTKSFRVRSNEYFIPLASNLDIAAEKAKLAEELQYIEGFLKAVQKKLSNERFVNNAPKQVVDVERKKEADALAKLETIKESLAGLSN